MAATRPLRLNCPTCSKAFTTPAAGRYVCPHCGVSVDVTSIGRPAEPSIVGAIVFLVLLVTIVVIVFTGHFWWIIVAAIIVFPILWLLRSVTGLADLLIFRKR